MPVNVSLFEGKNASARRCQEYFIHYNYQSIKEIIMWTEEQRNSFPFKQLIELRAKNIIAVATDREKMKPMLSSTANIIDILKRSLLDILLDETLKK